MHTFLFTDIEGSTRRWEEHPDEMAAALARHDAILTEAITQSHGEVIKATGDGMLARFDSASHSLAAAIDAQRRLAAETWGATGPLRVRMGIHTGESENRGGDYFGPTMNRTARIMAAGHGSQVLLSADARDLVASSLPPDVHLRDLGVHRLKDLTLPEQLFQLVVDDLPSDFPPPRTLDARPHNLPLQTTEFFGREAELSTIAAMLLNPSTRLVTITGPGGAGKTRLALQVAAEQIDRFPDGVFFVDLSAERYPEAAYEAIVRALGLPAASGGDPLQILRSRLRDQEMLLLLDNFEQVTEAGVGIADLLNHAPGLKAIVTSRATLRVRAEHVFPVPPLSLPHPKGTAEEIASAEAVQLFVERATAVRPSFAIGADNAAVIAEICLRLDGLPLAIELAAARLNVFSPAELLERLRTRLDVLGAGGRDLPDRQRTLWAAIGWSYELLSEEEREVFELMAVFSSARLPAIEAVGASLGLDSVLDALAGLVDKSLIRSDDHKGVQRFSMLLMIKEYAESLLSQNPVRERAVRKAHALHFAGFAHRLKDQLASSERESVLRDLESEIGNLRTAWRYWVGEDDLEQLFQLVDGLWALHEAKGWYWAAIELASDALEVLGRAEPSDRLATEELTLRTSFARALMAVRGYGPEVEAAFQKVLAMTEEQGQSTQLFPVLRSLATYYTNLMNFEQAAEIGKRLLEIGEQEQDDSKLVEGHYVRGVGLAFSGDIDRGLPHLDEAIRLYNPRLHSNRFRLGPITGVLARVASGMMLWQGGAIEEGINRIEKALALAREVDHPYSIAYGLWHNGYLALGRSRFEEALQRAGELSAIAEENDYPLWATLGQVLEGVSLSALGDIEKGLVLTEVGIQLYQGLTTPPIFWPNILSLRARVQAMAGNPERALELINEAIAFRPLPEMVDPEILLAKGDFLQMLPQPRLEEAEQAYLQTIAIANMRRQSLLELQARNHLVALRRALGRSPDGSEGLAVLYATFGEGLDEVDLVTSRELLAAKVKTG